MGAHQQIDRISRRMLDQLLPKGHTFPAFKDIVRFEGKKGPDAIKIKSPGLGEPWHYLDPLEHENSEYKQMIRYHFDLLVESLRKNNQERASFEAAWLAHAIVDGLTPAHHYPYEAKIEELRGGKTRHSRTTISEKMLFKGDTVSHTIGNMYKVYGPKGLFTAHHLFEFGVMLLLRPLRLGGKPPDVRELQKIANIGPEEYFLHSAREVAALELYEAYLQKGWTPVLTNRVRHKLAPVLVKTVTVLWYEAAREAGLCE